MDTITTLLRVTRLMFAVGLDDAVLVLPVGPEQMDASRKRPMSTQERELPPRRCRGRQRGHLANGLGLTAGMARELSLALAASAVALILGGLVVLVRTFS